jgi:drug/metabolite transporter (DMT)-like permease
VDSSVTVGIVFAVLTAFASIVGFLYKHKGAVESPPIEWRRPVRSSLALFGSKWYVLGIVIATGSWGFHVTALALAPISLVQSVIAGGLVLVTVVGSRLFGEEVTRREWIGVALTAAGLAFLAATLEGTGDAAHADYGGWALALYVGLATVAGLVLVVARGGSGLALAVAAGLLWAGSDITIKALSGKTEALGLAVIVHPFALVILVLSLVGLLVSARSLQIGPAVPVIAFTSTTANVLTIAAGPIVFGEPLPGEPLGLAVRFAAFALVIGAAAMTPPPMRAPAPA